MRRGTLIEVTVVLLLMLVGTGGQVAWAQTDPRWEPPTILSQGITDDAGEPADGYRPALIVDSWGMAHAFWGARTDPQGQVRGNTIYYALWDQGGWSGPHDVIFIGNDNNQNAVPQAAVDSAGMLHLVWLRRGTLEYSRASVWQAQNAQAWAEPVLLSSGPMPASDRPAAIVTDADNAVHVMHLLGPDGARIMHTSSADGMAWSDPKEIASGLRSRLVNASIDERDRLHVVYHMHSADGVGVYYTRSDDKGATWSDPLLVDSHDDRYWGTYAPHYINVLAYEDQVHIAWHGAPRSQRWHQWSPDGGLTWGAPVQISPDLVFLTNPPAMAVDGSGILHLVSVGAGAVPEDQGTAVLHTTWRGGQWTPLQLVCTEADEGVAIAIGDGTTLIAVWDDRVLETTGQRSSFAVWTSSNQLDASSLPVAALPSPAPSDVDPDPLPEPTPAATATSSVQSSLPQTEVAPVSESPLMPVLAGTGLAVLMVAAVLLAQRPWR